MHLPEGTTNNVAEFSWIVAACQDASRASLSHIGLACDSLLAVKFLKGDNSISTSHPDLAAIARTLKDAAKLIGSQRFSMVVSTLPRKIWAQPGDDFIYSQGWATSGELARAICQGIGSNSIVCDGTDKVTWSRASRVFGHYTVEWPWNDGERPTYGNEEAKIARLMKPLRCKTDVQTGDALVSGGPPWVFAGRYGEWKKGVVVTDTWAVVNRALEDYIL
jgi:ribonuclease HI